MDSTQSKSIFAVIGIGRSGTSVIARSLKALGIDLGDHLLPGDDRNPKGFYEDADILYKINRGVTYALDNSWRTELSEENINNNNILQEYKKTAITLLQKRLANTDYWGFKDPRTTTILPFWQSVFKSLAVQERYIIVIRNPLAVAHSHIKFAKSDLKIGLLLWVIHLFTAVEETHGKKRIVVCYEEMLKTPVHQLKRMHQAFSLPFALNDKEVQDFAEQFLEKTLSHYQFSDEDFASSYLVSVIPLSLKIYNLLKKLSLDELSFESAEFNQKWQMIREEFNFIYPMYQYLEQQVKRYHLLERELRRIHQSFFWKVTYPFRKIKNSLRMLRRRTKEAKRLIVDLS